MNVSDTGRRPRDVNRKFASFILQYYCLYTVIILHSTVLACLVKLLHFVGLHIGYCTQIAFQTDKR